MTDTTLSVCCIGAASYDRSLRLSEPAVVGTSNPAKSEFFCGGVARNIAENLSRLSVSCQLHSVVGDDAAGKQLIDETRAVGVNIDGLAQLPGENTASYLAAIQPNGELFLGLADMAIFESLDVRWLQSIWTGISPNAAIFADTNLPADTFRTIVAHAAAEHRRLFVDAVSVSKARRFPNNLNGIETVICNRDEAKVICESDNDDVAVLAGILCTRGAHTAVVTSGAGDIGIANATNSWTQDFEPIDTVDVTGAGDALIAGLIFGRMHELETHESVRLGVKAAALTVTSKSRCSPALSKEKLLAEISTIPT